MRYPAPRMRRPKLTTEQEGEVYRWAKGGTPYAAIQAWLAVQPPPARHLDGNPAELTAGAQRAGSIAHHCTILHTPPSCRRPANCTGLRPRKPPAQKQPLP